MAFVTLNTDKLAANYRYLDGLFEKKWREMERSDQAAMRQ